LWYASYLTKITPNKNNAQHKNKLKNLYKNQILNPTKHFKTKNQINTFLLPSNWRVLITSNQISKTNLITIITPSYIIKLPLFFNKQSVNYDPITNQILIKHFTINNFSQLYINVLKLFLTSLYKPFFTKIKFKGKGYYIYKNYRNTITPQFGYSHRMYLYAYFTQVKFLTKTSLIVFGVNKNDLSIATHKLFDWRPLNIFTGRGVRFAKQTIYKKAGKVSSYR